MKRILGLIVCSLLMSAGSARAVDCQFNTTQPTIPNQQFIILQCDNNGNLKVVGSASGGAFIADQGVGVASFASPAPVTVSNASATLIVAARTGAPGTGRAAVTITCVAAVAIGMTSGVTFAGNAQIPAGASLTLNTTSAVYGIATGSSTVCNAWETF